MVMVNYPMRRRRIIDDRLVTPPIRSRQVSPTLIHTTSLFILALAAVLTVMHWWILGRHIPVFTALPYWFFGFHEQTVVLYWLGIASAALSLTIMVSFSEANILLRLVLLVMLGSVVQFGVAFSKGRGLDGIRDEMVYAGHAEFATAAVQQASILDVMSHYEALAGSGQLGLYAPAKPPGTLALYMLTERLANASAPDAMPERRLAALRTFASVLWPVLSYLVLFPLYVLSRIFLDQDKAFIPCLLYICIPSVTLVTLHTDQVFFPLFSVLPVTLVALACRYKSLWLAMLAGVFFYTAMFCSFGLSMVAVLMLATIAAMHITMKDKTQWFMLLASVVFGAIASDILARHFLSYDIVVRYSAAMHYHEAWKGWSGGISLMLSAGVTNLLEFFSFLGAPLSTLLLASMLFSVYRAVMHKHAHPGVFISAALCLVFCLLLIFGHTKAETARLWLFLIPFICLSVTLFIREQCGIVIKRDWVLVASIVVALEAGTIYMLLRHHNFA